MEPPATVEPYPTSLIPQRHLGPRFGREMGTGPNFLGVQGVDKLLKKAMFREAMKGNWIEVIGFYGTDEVARRAKITQFGDTAIHVAIMAGEREHVRNLIEKVPDEELLEIMSIVNDKGNTPLHLAASQGDKDNLKYMVDRVYAMLRTTIIVQTAASNADEQDIDGVVARLIKARNEDGESTLFMAALNREMEGFSYLFHSRFKHYYELSDFRRKDGKTILHCAILEEHFDVAFKIIKLYPDLVGIDDIKGYSPLHALAANPAAFKSSTHLSRIDSLIYSCIPVNRLKYAISSYAGSSEARSSRELHHIFPVNWPWLSFLPFMKMVTGSDGSSTTGDPENHADNDNEIQIDFEEEVRGPCDCRELFMKVVLLLTTLGTFLGNVRQHLKNFILPSKPQGKPPLRHHKGRMERIKEKKQKHIWAAQVLKELVAQGSYYEYEERSMGPESSPNEIDKELKETPILLAARMGIKEMVKIILENFPIAIEDRDEHEKNIVMVAAEYKHPQLFKLILESKFLNERLFQVVDKKKNNALHLAAKAMDKRIWHITGTALQMQWEIKWFNFLKESLPPHLSDDRNDKEQTPTEVFAETHEMLVTKSATWLFNVSQSCSVVAALIATVAFATAYTVPGGVKQDSGFPTFEGKPAFDIFAASSLAALCFSLTSLVMFLAILTSRHKESDFGMHLPLKLIFGLSSLFISIASMLVSFCAGHFFVLEEKLKYAAYPIYAVTAFPISLFAVAQFPLYIDLIRAITTRMPRRSYAGSI